MEDTPPIAFQDSALIHWKKIFNRGAQRHHYSMFDVGCSMFDIQLIQ